MDKNRIKLTVIIPVFNEKATLEKCIDAVRNCGLENLEIIVVDDCSTDGTRKLIKQKLEQKVDKVLYHKRNQGKGAALRTGFREASGDYVIVQDADLEYDPKEFSKLLEPFVKGRADADVVYGSRYAQGNRYNMVKGFWHSLGNGLLTTVSNIFSDLSLTDMETCYKMFKCEIIRNINIQENRFGFEPEITAKIAKKHYKIYEVPISYYPRSYAQGKKIGIKDGFRAFYCIIKYNLFC